MITSPHACASKQRLFNCAILYKIVPIVFDKSSVLVHPLHATPGSNINNKFARISFIAARRSPVKTSNKSQRAVSSSLCLMYKRLSVPGSHCTAVNYYWFGSISGQTPGTYWAPWLHNVPIFAAVKTWISLRNTVWYLAPFCYIKWRLE